MVIYNSKVSNKDWMISDFYACVWLEKKNLLGRLLERVLKQMNKIKEKIWKKKKKKKEEERRIMYDGHK